MRRIIFILLLPLFSFAAPKPAVPDVPKKPPVVEQWLTAERRAQLEAVTSRPYITRKRPIGKGMEEIGWTNGSRSWATTQAVTRIAGAKAANGWQKRLDASEAAKAAILADIDALRKQPSVSKRDLDAISEKHSERKAK